MQAHEPRLWTQMQQRPDARRPPHTHDKRSSLMRGWRDECGRVLFGWVGVVSGW